MTRDHSPEELSRSRDQSPGPKGGGLAQHRPELLERSDRSRTPENRTPLRAAPDKSKSAARSIEPRKALQLRNRTYRLRDSEIQTMGDIGKFRALATKDLEDFGYAGNRPHLHADLVNLRRQGLIVQRGMPRKDAPPRRLVALTKEGRQLLIAHEAGPEKPDTLLRLFQASRGAS